MATLCFFHPMAGSPLKFSHIRSSIPNFSCSSTSDFMGSKPVDNIKADLQKQLSGINRGIFGVETKKKIEIEELLRLLENHNPCSRPAENLEKLNGKWRLLYSTISVLGPKRTKLGLRDFITLGDIVQQIDVDQRQAVNTVAFNVSALSILNGTFTIESTYAVSSPMRVDIEFKRSAIVPNQLFNLFKKNYDLLLSIFNPEGWLDITYVDGEWRIGRDDKGNIFLLERMIE